MGAEVRMFAEGVVCSQCRHAFDDHAIIATGSTPSYGGIILCPAKACQCFSTWDVRPPEEARPEVWVPPDEEVEAMRKVLQR